MMALMPAQGRARKSPRRISRKTVAVDFALQGGGAHGAFAWGVLDRALQMPSMQLDGISGTSAGAMNAAVLAEGGPEGARAALERFWRRVSAAATLSPLFRGPLDILLGNWALDNSPMFVAMDLASRVFSPYDLGVAAFNPLRAILAESINFGRLRKSPIKIFITTTNVQTGRGRVFRNAELTIDALLASACVPTIYKAIEIDGQPYWDGGYAGNPTITPLVRECNASDTILIQINPIHRPGIPKSARDILNRLNEISFNSPLVKELRMIALLRRVSSPRKAESALWARMRIHRIASDWMVGLSSSSKLIAEWGFLQRLRDEGRRCAERFIAAHGRDLGRRSSLDLDAFLEGV
jgi:NTE family protein